MNMQVAKNSVITLDYHVTDPDGEIVDEGREPLIYLHGGYDDIFPLIEEALQGKKIGESVQVKLQPDEAFGDYDAEMVQVEPRKDCVLFGVSRDDCMKHAEFRDKEGIGIDLLSDAEGTVCKQYGVWQARDVDGHKKFGISRSTFIIDRSGIIRHALYNVNYKGHALEVLRLVKELNS